MSIKTVHKTGKAENTVHNNVGHVVLLQQFMLTTTTVWTQAPNWTKCFKPAHIQSNVLTVSNIYNKLSLKNSDTSPDKQWFWWDPETTYAPCMPENILITNHLDLQRLAKSTCSLLLDSYYKLNDTTSLKVWTAQSVMTETQASQPLNRYEQLACTCPLNR